MAISNDFKEAVEQNKTTRVRIMMKDSLLLDPTGVKFDEMLQYAKNYNPEIMDSHDGEVFKECEKWDDDYYDEQMVQVVNNFSTERIDLLKRMAQSRNKKKNEPENKASSMNSETATMKTRETISGTRIAGGAVALVGAGLLIGGLVVSEAPIAVPIIGGVVIVAGAALIFKK